MGGQSVWFHGKIQRYAFRQLPEGIESGRAAAFVVSRREALATIDEDDDAFCGRASSHLFDKLAEDDCFSVSVYCEQEAWNTPWLSFTVMLWPPK